MAGAIIEYKIDPQVDFTLEMFLVMLRGNRLVDAYLNTAMGVGSTPEQRRKSLDSILLDFYHPGPLKNQDPGFFLVILLFPLAPRSPLLPAVLLAEWSAPVAQVLVPARWFLVLAG
ncbi:hypothetical protein ES703_120473 [subsurface metagenome]